MVRILTWNINGLKAVIKNRQTTLKGFLDSLSADILCLQEVKTTKDQIEEDIAIAEGYTSYFSFCKIKQGYSGVVTFCRSTVTPIAAEEGITGCCYGNEQTTIGCPVIDLSDEEAIELNNEGRGLLTEHRQGNGQSLVIINVYCPRVDPEQREKRLPYKLNFLRVLHERCKKLQAHGKDVVVCGDMNCVMEVIDSAAMEDMPTFTKEPETKELMSTFISSKTPPTTNDVLLDSYRYMNPDVKGAYTCWCTVTSSRQLNYGQRIDYILVSKGLVDSIEESNVLQDEMGSDHCPVKTQLDINIVPSQTLPLLCFETSLRLSGKQSKLSSFFTKKSSIKRPLETTGETLNAKKKPCLDNETRGVEEQKQKDTPTLTSTLKTNSSKLSSDWQKVFKAPPKAPLCSGHQEPAVLRVVKKPGPNQHKRFYVCGRPDGSKNDPKARCNFFKWSK